MGLMKNSQEKTKEPSACDVCNTMKELLQYLRKGVPVVKNVPFLGFWGGKCWLL